MGPVQHILYVSRIDIPLMKNLAGFFNKNYNNDVDNSQNLNNINYNKHLILEIQAEMNNRVAVVDVQIRFMTIFELPFIKKTTKLNSCLLNYNSKFPHCYKMAKVNKYIEHNNIFYTSIFLANSKRQKTNVK